MFKTGQEQKWEILAAGELGPIPPQNIKFLRNLENTLPNPERNPQEYQAFSRFRDTVWEQIQKIAQEEQKSISNGPLVRMPYVGQEGEKVTILAEPMDYKVWAATSYAPAHPQKFEQIFREHNIDPKKIPQNWISYASGPSTALITNDDKVIMLLREGEAPNRPFTWSDDFGRKGYFSLPGGTLWNWNELMEKQGEHIVKEAKKRLVQTLSGPAYSFPEDAIQVDGVNSVNAAQSYYNELQIGLEARIDTYADNILKNRQTTIGVQQQTGAKKYADAFALSLAYGARELIDFLNDSHYRIQGGVEPVLIIALVNRFGPDILKPLSHIKPTDNLNPHAFYTL